jgi:NAD-dependent DNA ligase
LCERRAQQSAARLAAKADGEKPAKAPKKGAAEFKDVANLLAAIEAHATVGLDRFIFGLGMRHVGETTGRLLARSYGTLDHFVEEMEKAAADRESSSWAELLSIDGIGTVVAEAIVDFFAEEHNREVVVRLKAAGVDPQPLEKQETNSPVAGKTVVFTGTLETLTRPGGQGAGGIAGRQGRRIGLEKDRLCRRRRRIRIEAEGGARTWRHRADRGRVAGLDLRQINLPGI